MIKYTGAFKKKDGSVRVMEFISEADATKTKQEENTTHPFGNANENGMVLVYDVVVGGFRYFNTKTQIGHLGVETGWDGIIGDQDMMQR